MALVFYDSTQTPFGVNPLRSHHHGQLGSIHEELIYIRNDNVLKYYTTVSLAFEPAIGLTGWSVKMMYGQRRPTEVEWDLMPNGSTISLPDIGTTAASDTFTYHPVWVRIYSPAGEPAQIKTGQQLKLTVSERNVGS